MAVTLEDIVAMSECGDARATFDLASHFFALRPANLTDHTTALWHYARALDDLGRYREAEEARQRIAELDGPDAHPIPIL